MSDVEKANRAKTSIAVAQFIGIFAFFVVLYGFVDSISRGEDWRSTAFLAVALVVAPVLPWLFGRSGAKQAESKGRTPEVGRTLGRKDGAWSSAWILIFGAFFVYGMKLSESLGHLP